MSTIRKLNTTSTTKTYKSYEAAQKAFESKYSEYDVAFLVVQLNEHNCENPKHHGRFVPVGLGEKAIQLGVHFNFHIVG